MLAYPGTSGFSYSAWKGTFYPSSLKSAEMLTYYSTRLPSVELNNTFYRMPRRSLLANWAKNTPDLFRFSVKATRRITHFNKLRDCEELLNYLFSGLSVLGSKLGTVLFQLPPTLTSDLCLLKDFLQRLPRTLPGEDGLVPTLTQICPAFEFRHPSWQGEGLLQLLADYGAALVSGDRDDGENLPLSVTSSFAYLRLRRRIYTEKELDHWVERLHQSGVSSAFCFFKHEELAPQLALSLSEKLSSTSF